ncbi:MAG: M48 family metalloprotease, partial [Candidatus Limnocylindrales bacterium]
MIARTTFHSEEAANRRQSVLLAVIVLVVLAALGFAIGYGVSGDLGTAYIVVLGAVLLSLLLTAGSYFGGDSLVLSTSHAHEVTAQQAPQLFDVVQEMAIAGNVPMPRVYIIDDSAPDAFATGRDPKHASVAITTGLLQKLDREELQGVIGHPPHIPDGHIKDQRSELQNPTPRCNGQTLGVAAHQVGDAGMGD